MTEKNREEFLAFVQPEHIREGLKTERVISYRYSVFRHGKESYEMVRFAGVRHPEDRDDHLVHAVGACFTNVDEETRASIAQVADSSHRRNPFISVAVRRLGKV